MAIFAISHSNWQTLRAAKRGAKIGRDLRYNMSRHTRDGDFLNQLVAAGLLIRINGDSDRPFESTYKLTKLGEHAAEYGEAEMTDDQYKSLLR